MDGKQVSNQILAEKLAQALMLEQVKFIKKKLIETDKNDYIEKFVHQIYLKSDEILLKDVIQLEQLNAVVQKYAFDLNLGPELLEFIGVIAQKIHQFSVSSQTSIQDFISDHTFELWINKILELDQARFYLQSTLQNNPKAQLISLQLANQIVESNTPWLDQLRKVTQKNKGITSKLLTFVQDQHQMIELKLEQQLAQMLLKQLGYIITLPSEELTEIALDVWSELKTKSLSETTSQIAAIDLEDFFILVYETWRELRKIPHMQNIILDVVDAFYTYFGDYTLQELLLAVGIQEQDLHEESKRFIPFTLKAFEANNILDDIINTLIEPFYTDENTLALIDTLISQKNER